MFTIRSAGQEDLDAMAAVAKARAIWMRGHGLADWDGWRRYADHVALPAWVVTDHYGAVAGFTCPFRTRSPEPCGYGALRPTLSISLTCTHPGFARQHPGALIARWAIDHAARSGVMWVRYTCMNHHLAAYSRDVLGWTIVRHLDTQDDEQLTYVLAHPTGRQR